ncbi:MAG: hypothetical protein ACR2IS_18240 [Nitrososphaeraceae archaeon]
MSQNAAWHEVLKKVAFGIDNCDLGKVQKVGSDIIVTEKGIANKKKYFIPMNFIAGFDGHAVYFKITKEDAKRFRWDNLGQHMTNK